MDEQADILKRVIEALEGMAVPYMIRGGIALAVWAVPRTTYDVDFVVDIPNDRIAEFCAYFTAERNYIDAEAMQAAFENAEQPSLGMYSFSDTETGLKIDLFPLRKGDETQASALNRRMRTEILPGLQAAVYAPDDLLVQKLRWYAGTGSERQYADCLNLVLTDLKRPARMIEWDYIDKLTGKLGPDVQQAWNRVRNAAEEATREPFV